MKQYNLEFLKDYFEDNMTSILPILKMYLEETPKEILNIENFLNNKDTAGAKAATHKIKANLAMLGIPDSSGFMNDMHALKPTEMITEKVMMQFSLFRNLVEESLAQIRVDFFTNKKNGLQ